METEFKGRYVIVTTRSSGIFAGELKERKGTETTLLNARKIFFYSGACTLSQLAMDGVSKPLECKFPCEVGEVLLLNTESILYATDKARKSIKDVPICEA